MISHKVFLYVIMANTYIIAKKAKATRGILVAFLDGSFVCVKKLVNEGGDFINHIFIISKIFNLKSYQ